MPMIIGFVIGKVIGSFLIGLITMLMKLLYWSMVAAAYVVKYAFMGCRWLIGKLRNAGMDWYDNCKLNLN